MCSWLRISWISPAAQVSWRTFQWESIWQHIDAEVRRDGAQTPHNKRLCTCCLRRARVCVYSLLHHTHFYKGSQITWWETVRQRDHPSSAFPLALSVALTHTDPKTERRFCAVITHTSLCTCCVMTDSYTKAVFPSTNSCLHSSTPTSITHRESSL